MGALASEMAAKSFKINRNSPVASKLRPKISRKLPDFIADFIENDDLTEYIVVLVCNGKDQNQAKDDLEEFLGQRSAEFVTWLWDLISEYVPESNITEGLSIAKDVMITSLQDGDTGTDFKTNRPRKHCYQCSRNSTSSRINVDKYDKLNTKEASLRSYEKKLTSKHGPNGTTSGDFQMYMCVDDDPSASEPRKIPTVTCSDTFKKVTFVPKREAHFGDMPSSPSGIKQEIPRSRKSFELNVSRRSLSPREVDVASPLTNKSRRSVWDRLGRPSENMFAKVKSVYMPHVGIIKQDDVPGDHTLLESFPIDECKKSSIDAARFGKRVLNEFAALDHTIGIMYPNKVASSNRQKRPFDEVITDTGKDECKKGSIDAARFGKGVLNECASLDRAMDITSPNQVANSNRQKRPFDEVITDADKDECKKSSIDAARFGKGVLNECAGLNRAIDLMSPNQVASSNRQNIPFCEVITDAGIGSTSLVGEKDTEAHSKEKNLEPNISSFTAQASEVAVLNMVSGCSLLADKAESIKHGTSVMPVQSQVIDVKLRLRQVEMEMYNLQKKQEEMKKAGKSQSSFSLLRNTEEFMEGITVLVTNVHFAATKEALVSYFTKCGPVNNVVILTDPVSSQPKGSAYITFTNQDSVDKAVKLSGMSFFSRIIKVYRKDEVGTVISAQAQFAREPPQLAYYNDNKNTVTVSPFITNSHLQWRRESVSSGSTIQKKSGDIPLSL